MLPLFPIFTGNEAVRLLLLEPFQKSSGVIWMLFSALVLTYGLGRYWDIYHGGYGRYDRIERQEKLVSVSRYTICALVAILIAGLVGFGNAFAIAFIVIILAIALGILWLILKALKAILSILPNFFRSAMGKSV